MSGTVAGAVCPQSGVPIHQLKPWDQAIACLPAQVALAEDDVDVGIFVEAEVFGPDPRIFGIGRFHEEVVEEKLNQHQVAVVDGQAVEALVHILFNGIQAWLRAYALEVAADMRACEGVACFAAHADRFDQDDLALEVGDLDPAAIVVGEFYVRISLAEPRGPSRTQSPERWREVITAGQ